MGNDPGRLEPPRLFGRRRGAVPKEPAPAPDEPREPDDPGEPEPERGRTTDEPLDAAPDRTGADADAAPAPVVTAEDPATQESTPRTPRTPRTRRTKRVRACRRVRVNGTLAAVVAGALAGIVLSGLTWAAEAASDPADSNRLNAAILVAIFVLSVIVGAITLRLLDVPSPGTIAFLGTALVAVIAVVALSAHFDDVVGAVAGVVLSALAYPLAHWVTERYIDV